VKTEETNISAELRTLWVGKDISTSTTSTSDDYILAKSVGSAIPIWSKSGGCSTMIQLQRRAGAMTRPSYNRPNY